MGTYNITHDKECMTKNNQFLDAQTRCEENFIQGRPQPCLFSIFVTRILMRHLFAVANLTGIYLWQI